MKRALVLFISESFYIERVKEYIREIMPHKVLFVLNEYQGMSDRGSELNSANIKKEYKKELTPWTIKNSEEITANFMNFEELFSNILKFVLKEQKEGYEVTICLNAGSFISSNVTSIISTLTNCKVIWLLPREVKNLPQVYEFKFPFPINIPEGIEKYILLLLKKNGGLIKSKLSKIAEEISFEKDIKESSKIVQLSRTLKRMKQEGIIETKKLSPKVFEIKLNERGRILGEIIYLFEKFNGK